MINGIPANLKRIKATSEKIIKVYFDNNRDENSLRIIHTML